MWLSRRGPVELEFSVSGLEKNSLIRAVNAPTSALCLNKVAVSRKIAQIAVRLEVGGPGTGGFGTTGIPHAHWTYNRVTQSLPKTLFLGGNRAGFVLLQAGVLTSLAPSLQGMLTATVGMDRHA